MIPRCSRLTLFSICCAIIILAIGAASPRADDPPAVTVTVTRTVTSTYRGKPAHVWAARYRTRTRQLQAARALTRSLRRTLVARPSVSEAINLAAAVYGNGSTLWALARCESGLNPGARNASGSSGLLQFMPGTFASTPYGGFSIWSPYANALAGGWMLAHGRRGEWVC